MLLAATAGLLLIYYLALVVVGDLGHQTDVAVAREGLPPLDESVHVEMRVVEADPAKRTLQALMRPLSETAEYEGDNVGELSEPLLLQVFSSGRPPSSFAFPADSTVDEVAVDLELTRGSSFFPLDRPVADFRLSLETEEGGEPVPTNVELRNESETWVLDAAASRGQEGTVQVEIEARRDSLSIGLTVFNLMAIVLTTLIAVSVIGRSVILRDVEFSQVVWLSATLVAFPALRSAMPGAPPIGTTIDYLFFFPCMCIIAAALLTTAVMLAWRERPSQA